MKIISEAQEPLKDYHFLGAEAIRWEDLPGDGSLSGDINTPWIRAGEVGTLWGSDGLAHYNDV